jgi:hypothetical protein
MMPIYHFTILYHPLSTALSVYFIDKPTERMLENMVLLHSDRYKLKTREIKVFQEK